MWRVPLTPLLRVRLARASLTGGRTHVRSMGSGRGQQSSCMEGHDPMPQVPRIRRTEPSAEAYQPERPLAVEVTMIWHHGGETDFDGLAVAWTPKEVEVEWTTPWGDRRRDWVRADQVRRR